MEINHSAEWNDAYSSTSSGREIVGIRMAISGRHPGLQQIPEIAVEVGEHRHGAVAFFLRLADEDHAFAAIGRVVAPEIVGVKEKEDAAPVWFPMRDDCSSPTARASSRSGPFEPGGATVTQRLSWAGM
jgi:hypothetical protein